MAAAPDPAGVELGVKFRVDVDGFITGVRFYKGAGNSGQHIGNLWTTAGQLLASGVFTGESSTGWQQLDFAEPVAVSANTVYVASYHAPAVCVTNPEPDHNRREFVASPTKAR
jgi:hypothetical protein